MPASRPLIALAFAMLAIAVDGPVQAQTARTGDEISRWLVERGIIPASAIGAVAAEPLPGAAGPGAAGRLREGPSEMIVAALNFLDVAYRYGGKTEVDGFDCSGFTRHVFRTAGLALPVSADEQANAPGLVGVERAELLPGDLVFFNTLQRTYSHVGLYVGNDRFIHAPRTGSQVRVEDMRKAYWASRFTGGRRVGAWSDPLFAFSR